MKIIKVPISGYESNCFILLDEISGEYAMIDPSASPAAIDETVKKFDLSPDKFKYALLTHGHFDHIYSADYVREKYHCTLACHKNDAECLSNSELNANKLFFEEELVMNEPELLLLGGDTLYLGDNEISVIHTPGHRPGCVCYLSGNDMFCGDTIFDRSVGRTDLIGGNTNELLQSLVMITEMDPEIKLYPGHGPITTIKEQIKNNPYLKGF